MKNKDKYAEALCNTCKNNFISKEEERDLTLFISNKFCVYTHEKEEAVECSFYNRIPSVVELRRKVEVDSDSGESTKYQDIDRTYTTGERQLNNRFDCRCVA